jgi:hypothetical protein
MNYAVDKFAKSLAAYLSDLIPGITFYEDPRQQKTKLPAMFLQLMSSDIKPLVGGRLRLTLRFDLTCLEDYNLPDLQMRYQATSQVLDLTMETFPYSDGEEEGLLRTYNRQAQIDLDALHYKFDLQLTLTKEEARDLINSILLRFRVEVKDGES